MESQAQPSGRQAHHQQANEQDLSRVELVEQVTKKRLRGPVHQPADGGGNGNFGAAPFESLAHGEHENTESVARPSGHRGDEHGGSDYVPAIVDAFSLGRCRVGVGYCLTVLSHSNP